MLTSTSTAESPPTENEVPYPELRFQIGLALCHFLTCGFLKSRNEFLPFLPSSVQNLKNSEVFNALEEIASFFDTSVFYLSKQQKSELENSEFVAIQEVPKSLGELVSLYETLISPDVAKKSGVTYTPVEIADRIVSMSLTEINPINSIKILDPACGTGIFLISSVNAALSKIRPSNLANALEIASRSIYGIDRDPLSVTFAKLFLNVAIWLHFPEPHPAFPSWNENFVVGNTLVDGAKLSALSTADSRFVNAIEPFRPSEKFSKILSEGGFDLVIGNPPYGLSRGEQLSSIENGYLKSAYSDVLSGRVNKFLLFMARGWEFLKDDGVLSYIVPNSWLGIKEGQKIREMLLKNGELCTIEAYDFPVFGSKGVEAVTFIAKRGAANDFLTFRKVKSISDSSHSNEVKIPIDAIRRDHSFKIPTNWSSETSDILSSIDSVSFLLGSNESPFIPAIALQAYSVGRGTPPQTAEVVKSHPFHTESKLSETSYPYLEGKDISRYRITWSGSYLNYGPWLAEPQNIDRFTGPRIAVREILAPAPYRIIAALTDDVTLYNKSVLHIRLKKHDNRKLLLSLLGILNSKIGSFILSQRGRKSDRKLFPKILNDDLKNFPIPKSIFESNELAILVETALATAGHISDKLNQQIDTLVTQQYQLS